MWWKSGNFGVYQSYPRETMVPKRSFSLLWHIPQSCNSISGIQLSATSAVLLHFKPSKNKGKKESYPFFLFLFSPPLYLLSISLTFLRYFDKIFLSHTRFSWQLSIGTFSVAIYSWKNIIIMITFGSVSMFRSSSHNKKREKNQYIITINFLKLIT